MQPLHCQELARRHLCRVQNSLLRVFDKAFYIQGGGSGVGRIE